MQALCEQLHAVREQLAVFLTRHVVYLPDRGAGQDVVELVEQDGLPVFIELLLGIVAAQKLRPAAEKLDVLIQQLAAAVVPLVARHRGIGSAMVFEV